MPDYSYHPAIGRCAAAWKRPPRYSMARSPFPPKRQSLLKCEIICLQIWFQIEECRTWFRESFLCATSCSGRQICLAMGCASQNWQSPCLQAESGNTFSAGGCKTFPEIRLWVFGPKIYPTMQSKNSISFLFSTNNFTAEKFKTSTGCSTLADLWN